MMKINFDSSNKTPQPWTIVLCKRNKDRMGQLHNITDLRGSFNLNSAQELSFTLHKELNGVEERLWDEVYNLKIIWVKELDSYFQIEVDVTDSKVDNIKDITATSLCEAELSQIMLHDIQINETEDIESFTILHPEMSDEEVREACQVKFWNKEYPERSLLYKVLHDKAPHYTIKHVDESLAGLQRTFTIDGTSIYDWLVGDCSEQFDCIFEFDSRDRSISAYDLFSVCENDNCNYYIETGNRYRENFNDFCPKCGSRKIHVYGHDTGIIVDKNNLTEEVQLTTDVDSIKNTFRLVAGDDTMTVAVQGINPNGSDYLYYFSEEMYHDMSDDLTQALRDYETKQESYEEEYSQIMLDMYDNLDETAELVHVRMPSYEIADMNAESEADILNNSDLSVIGFTSVSVPPSESTVNRAIEQYAKCFIHSGFFKVEAVNVTYTPSNLTWRGQLKISNYSNEYQGVNGDNIDDTAYTNYFTSTLVGADTNATSYEKYIQQKCDKIIANDIKNERDINVFNILKFYITPEYFRDHIGDYCLKRLTDFRDSLQSCIDVMQIEVASANTNTEEGRKTLEIYKRYYDKLIYLNGGYLYDDTNKSNYIDGKIPEYEIEKTRLESEYDSLVERQKEIQAELNFKNHLDSYNANLYEEFCSFRREDVYQNNNYISDYYVKNYDNAGLFDNARLFLKEANKQIRISAEYQHSISTNLYNLLLMEEFDPLIDNFELGNFIRVRVEDDIYRLRLIHYEVDFSDLSTLNTDFSDMTKTGNSLNDVKSILDSAQQMATSYGYIEKQAEKGTVAYGTLEDFRRDGLLSALYKINNNVNEEITFDHRGIMAKSYDDITDSYLDKQLRITHNILAFTKDNWRTVSLALGNFNYYDEDGVWREGYGINADFCISSYIQGSTIVGGKIMSPYDTSKYKNHMTILDLTNGDFKIGNQINGLEYTNYTLNLYGGTLSAPTINTGTLNSGTINGGTININDKFIVRSDGSFTATDGNITGNIYAYSGIIGGFAVNGTAIYSFSTYDSNGYPIADDDIYISSADRYIQVGKNNDRVKITKGKVTYIKDQSEIGRLGTSTNNNFNNLSLATYDGHNLGLGYINGSSIHQVLVINTNNNNNSTNNWSEKLIINDDVRLGTSEKLIFSSSSNPTSPNCYIGPMNTRPGIRMSTEVGGNILISETGETAFKSEYLLSVGKLQTNNSAYFYGNVHIAGTLSAASHNFLTKTMLTLTDFYYNYSNKEIVRLYASAGYKQSVENYSNLQFDVDTSNSNNILISQPNHKKYVALSTYDNFIAVDVDNPSNESDPWADLGSNDHPWRGITVQNVNNISDKKQKNHIKYFYEDNNLETFFMSLKPVEYTFNNDKNKVMNFGFYAQDVYQASKLLSNNNNITSCYSTLEQDVGKKNVNPDNYNDKDLIWSLNYISLIAPSVAMIQKHQEEIESLKEEIKQLKEIINNK